MSGRQPPAPTPFTRDAFEAFVLALPATTVVRQWGDASVAKVGGKIYAIFGGGVASEPAALSFKCSDLAFEMLPELHGLRPAPYLARAKWIAAAADCALTNEEVAAYLVEAHRLIAARLPKRVQAALGFDNFSSPPLVRRRGRS